MKLFRYIALMIMLSPFILPANEELISLYAKRMQAENRGRLDSLEYLDLELAEHYLAGSDFRSARIFLENALSYSNEPALTERKLDIYRLDIIEGKLSQAESGLISVYYNTLNIDQKSRAALLLGILNALKGEYPVSREFLTESLKLREVWDISFEMTLDSLLQDAKERKRAETAKWLSGFLPGAGQIYAKNAKGAVGAIGLAAFWGGWFAYDLIQGDYYSAVLVLLWPWQRYHRGNIQNAGYSVEAYNAVIEDRINRALLEYLSTK